MPLATLSYLPCSVRTSTQSNYRKGDSSYRLNTVHVASGSRSKPSWSTIFIVPVSWDKTVSRLGRNAIMIDWLEGFVKVKANDRRLATVIWTWMTGSSQICYSIHLPDWMMQTNSFILSTVQRRSSRKRSPFPGSMNGKKVWRRGKENLAAAAN